MKDCTSDNANACFCKWAAPGDKCMLTGECRFEGPAPGSARAEERLKDLRKNPPIQRVLDSLKDTALATQVGGSHYKDMPIQPVEFITKNKIGFLEGCVIKRVCRWRAKDGLQDLRKAIHEIELLIEMEAKP